MIQKKLLTHYVLAGLLVVGSGSKLAATVFWSNDFNITVINTAQDTPHAGYNAGYAPVTLDPTAFSYDGGMTTPTHANNRTSAGGRGAIVMAPGATGFSTNAVGMFSHPSVYGNDGADSGSFEVKHQSQQNGPLTGTTSGSYSFEFELSLGAINYDTSMWTEKPSMALKANYADKDYTITGVRDLISFSFSLNKIYMTSAASAPGGAEMVTEIATVSALTPVSIKTIVDMDTRTFSVVVDGHSVAGTYYLLEPGAVEYGLGGYRALGGKPDTTAIQAFTHFYDNIVLQTSLIPEPSASAAIAGVLALALVCRRKRG